MLLANIDRYVNLKSIHIKFDSDLLLRFLMKLMALFMPKNDMEKREKTIVMTFIIIT